MQQDDLNGHDRQRQFGEKLKKIRLDRNVTVDTLAQITRINHNYIEALEAGSFQQIPGKVFARGFVSNYLKHFGVDSGEFMTEFDAVWDVPNPSSVLKVEIKSRPVRLPSDEWLKVVSTVKSLAYRGVFTKAAMLILALGGLGLWGVGKVKNSVTTPSLKKVTVVEPAPVVVAKVNETVSEPAAMSIAPEKQVEEVSITSSGTEQVVEVEVLERVRLKADWDGKEKVAEEYKPGHYQFKFKSTLNLMVYDAGAVKINFNGRTLGALGTKGRVRRLSFEADANKAQKM